MSSPSSDATLQPRQPTTPGSTAAVSAQTARAPRSRQLCRNFLLGRCRYREGCRFIHQEPQEQKAEEIQNMADTGRRREDTSHEGRTASRKKPCYNRKAGKCFRGDKCWYSHDQIPANAAESTEDTSEASAPKTPQLNEMRLLQAVKEQRASYNRGERLEAERKARIAKEAARLVQEAERLAAIQKARAEAEAARKRKAEERKAAWLAREAEREKARLAAEEAARIREAKRLEAEQEAARRREIRAQEEAARQALLVAQEALRIEREAAFTTQHIVLGSTLITCGAGLGIRNVVSGFESCRVTIQNLPSDAKAPEIAVLFTQQGISRDDILILSIKPATGDRLEAKVLTSAIQGGKIATGLDGIEFRNATLRFEVSENASINAMGESSARQADTLIITWFAPSASMIATYCTMDEALESAKVLDRMIIGGCRIRVEMNQPPSGPAMRYYNPASVKFTGLPVDIPFDDAVTEWAGAASVRAMKSNIYNLHEATAVLQEHLALLPDSGMNTFDANSEIGLDGIVAARVRFESWDHAQRARASLEGKRLRPGYPRFRFSLPSPLHLISTIPIRQYEAQKRLWDSLQDDAKHDKGPGVYINRVPEREIVRIRLSGDDKKSMGALKVRVETLIAGEQLGATYWHRSFLWPRGTEFLAKVFSETGVYVRGDFKVQALKIYGEGNAKDDAHRMLEDEVARLAQLEWTVMLKRQTVGYFVRKGLAALKAVLGEDVVALDLASTPCKLTIRGGEEARHALNTLIDQSIDEVDLYTSGGGDDIYPICYDTVSHPVKLGCKHVYCTACIRHYFISAAETKVFPLVCMGNEANCRVPIPIPVIQRFLIRQQYEHLVNVAFFTYLDQHPQDFKYCTTPDCTQIYRADTKATLKCPSCFTEVCSSCHEEAHEGMTCDERRTRKLEAQEEEQLNEYYLPAPAAASPTPRSPRTPYPYTAVPFGIIPPDIEAVRQGLVAQRNGRLLLEWHVTPSS